MRILHALAISSLIAAGCSGARSYEYGPAATTGAAIEVAPPQPLYETPPPAPKSTAVWVGGFWDWNPYQGRYVWIGGRWTAPPRDGLVYLPPRWTHGRRGWVRDPGRWVEGRSVDPLGRRIWFDAAGRAHYF